MAENNRVLNHSEFAAKYNKQTEQDIASSYSEFSKSSDNFQEGFDEDTYDDGQSGPQRPIAGGNGETPTSPDSQPTPVKGMEAPEQEEEEGIDADEILSDNEEDLEDSDTEEEGGDFEGGDPEANYEDEDEEEDEEEEDEEEDEDTNESYKVKKNNFILESFDEFEARGPIRSQPKARGYDDVLSTIELDFDGDSQEYEDEEDSGECFVTCKSCGSKKEVEPGSYPMGAENEANPDSWWQGAIMGMQCGC